MSNLRGFICLSACTLMLTACSDTQQDKSKISKTTTTSTTISIEKDAVIEASNKKWDKKIHISKTEDVITEEIDPVHNEYTIEIVDKEFLEMVMSANDKIYSRSATNEDIKLINTIRSEVKEIAQKLNNDDAIKFVYKDEVGNIMVVAYSQKNRDIIPLEKEVSQNSGFIVEPNKPINASNTTIPKSSKKNNSTIIKPVTSTNNEGFQPYNGFGDYNEYLKYKNDTGYGNGAYDPSHPYPNEEATTIDPSLIQYSEDENGNLIMNPVYDYNNQE